MAEKIVRIVPLYSAVDVKGLFLKRWCSFPNSDQNLKGRSIYIHVMSEVAIGVHISVGLAYSQLGESVP